MTEAQDSRHPDPRIGLTITRLDLEAPRPRPDPVGGGPRLLRLVNARSGRIANNRLKGGPVELCDGPWEIVDNEYRGTMPGTVSQNVIAAHHHHRPGRARQPGPADWPERQDMAVPGADGQRVERSIEENVVVGIGPRDDDTIPRPTPPRSS